MTPQQEEMVVATMPKVRQLASHLARVMPPSVDRDDLISAGYLGVVMAAYRFTERHGVPFHLYALRRARGAMLDFLRGQYPVSGQSRRRTKRAVSIQLDVADEDGALRHYLQWPVDVTVLTAERALVHVRKEKARFVVRQLLQGFSQSEVAAQLGCSQAWCSHLRTQAIRDIRRAIMKG